MSTTRIFFVCAAVAVAGCVADEQCRPMPLKSPDSLGYALGVICNPAYMDCTPVNPGGKYEFPNDIYAHAGWAFQAYHALHGKGNPKFCTGELAGANPPAIPNHVADIFQCNVSSKCQLKPGVSDADASGIIGYMRPQLGLLCAPIDTGILMNATVQVKASYVMNIHYQPEACNNGKEACDFSGNGEIVPDDSASGGGTCINDSGGTCSLLSCASTRGPTTCINGACVCDSGYCAIDGACSCPQDTGGTCAHLSCDGTRGPTNCVKGKCLCKVGTCAIKGMCLDSTAAWAVFNNSTAEITV